MKNYKSLNEQIEKMKHLSSYKKGTPLNEQSSVLPGEHDSVDDIILNRGGNTNTGGDDCFNQSEACKKMKTHLLLSDYPKDTLNKEMVECFNTIDDDTKKCIQDQIASKFPNYITMAKNILSNLWDDFSDWWND